MKRLIILIIFGAAMQLSAQVFVGGHYAAGLSTIYFLPHSNESWRLTPYDAGFVFRYYADNETHKYFNIGIQVEMNLAARRYLYDEYISSSETIDDVSSSRIDTIRKKIYSQVIEIPVIMQWQFPITENFRLYLNGLIYAAYYFTNTAYYKNLDWQDVVEKFDYKNWNNFDFGIGGGIGAGYKIGTYEIGVDARFLMGISELYPQEASRYESLPQQFLLSISFIKKLGGNK